jgi:uncharacterized protein (TIGR02145 family)
MAKCNTCGFPWATPVVCTLCGSTDPMGLANNRGCGCLGNIFYLIVLLYLGFYYFIDDNNSKDKPDGKIDTTMVSIPNPEPTDTGSEGDNNDNNESDVDTREFGFYDISIGQQIWISRNLDIVRFSNGDIIPEALSPEDWETANSNKQPIWCYYDYNPSNNNKYGKLYNWYAVNDPRGLAPTGYRIPTDIDWEDLTTFLEGKDIAGEKLKSNYGWEVNGTNSIGFNAIPCGYVNENGEFSDIDKHSYWWTNTEHSSLFSFLNEESNALFRMIYSDKSDLESDTFDKRCGLSVRCIKE